MKKVFSIEVDCAVCASKCEEAIKKIDGVNDCSINYITQRLSIDYEDESVLKKAKKAALRIEPDFEWDIKK